MSGKKPGTVWRCVPDKEPSSTSGSEPSPCEPSPCEPSPCEPSPCEPRPCELGSAPVSRHHHAPSLPCGSLSVASQGDHTHMYTVYCKRCLQYTVYVNLLIAPIGY